MNTGINKNLLKSKMALEGLNNKGLASELGVTPHTITNLLSGKYNPSYELINGIYKILKLTPEEGYDIFFANNLRNTKVAN